MRIAILTSDNREGFRDYANPSPIMGIAPEALLQGFAALGNQVEVHVVSCLQQPVSSPEKIADNTWFHALHVPRIGWLRTLYQGCIRAVRKKLREIQPRIVHGQGTERDCALCAVYSGFPNLITVHGNMRAIAQYHRVCFGNYFWTTAKLETFALKRAAGVFCNSAYTESLVAPLAKRTWRVPNALRNPFFEPSKGAQPAAKPVMVNVGEISQRKNQLEILRLARKLHQRGFQFEMQFIGAIKSQSVYTADFQKEMAAAQAAGYARYLEPMSAPELVRTMDNASALLHFPGEEAFGLVTAEGLARNLKVFASAVGGSLDIASGVEGAELVPGNDWAGLEDAIGKWLGTGCPRPQTAGQTMRERYAPPVVAQKHLEIYQSLLR